METIASRTLAHVRSAIANLIGDAFSSFTCQVACECEPVRIVTTSADASVELIQIIASLPGTLIYFQGYALDGYEPTGSIFHVGGDAKFTVALLGHAALRNTSRFTA